MVSDEDVQMLDVVQTVHSTLKGKGKGTQKDHPADNDNLPWYILYLVESTTYRSTFEIRVEKYRPVDLHDVVSHKDIITTSKQLH